MADNNGLPQEQEQQNDVVAGGYLGGKVLTAEVKANRNRHALVTYNITDNPRMYRVTEVEETSVQRADRNMPSRVLVAVGTSYINEATFKYRYESDWGSERNIQSDGAMGSHTALVRTTIPHINRVVDNDPGGHRFYDLPKWAAQSATSHYNANLQTGVEVASIDDVMKQALKDAALPTNQRYSVGNVGVEFKSPTATTIAKADSPQLQL